MKDKRPRCPTCGHLIKSGPLSHSWQGGISKKKGTCKVCGGPTWHRDVTLCRKCYTSQLTQRTGPANPEWEKFTSTTTQQGRDRAKRRFKLGPCERCGKPGRHRHHKDRDTLNNEPSNIEILCFSCHQFEHNRGTPH